MVFKHDCTLLGNFKKTIAASAPRVSKTVPRWAAVWMILLCYLRREHGVSVRRYKLKYNEKRWGGNTFSGGKEDTGSWKNYDKIWILRRIQK